ncbi:MAG: TonB-dependent receptor [Prolixibacteraceae bacterium]|nr:TonB-dependent receptor [Prolixibacteraceae bacterium]
MRSLNYLIHVVLSVFFIMQIGALAAQTEYKITGQLLDKKEQPVMYANVALLNSADSSIIAGTVSGQTGKFELKYNNPGSYLISASFVGFIPVQKKVELLGNQLVDLGKIILLAKKTELNEVIIKGERLKAKLQVDKTTYYANSAMKKISNNGIDMIQHIPGVQVDLLQNISLNGSQDIIIIINGIERDGSFLAQLNPDKIDRVEIQNSPGVEHNAKFSGVINVILKKNENTGISGHLYANIPTASNEVFSFPTASLNYASENLTLYTAYNGEFSYFDIETEDKRVFSSSTSISDVIKNESLFQQNWSHKLHFGADYFFNENNQLNLYGFISRFSNEQSGSFCLKQFNITSENHLMQYKKDDFDINSSAYASVFFKHIFAESTELSFDVNYYSLESENRIRLSDMNSNREQVSHSKPRNNLLKTRLNFHFPVNQFIGVKTGFEQNLNYSSDDLMPEFSYTEITSAAYILANYSKNKVQANAGIRAEYLQYGNNNSYKNQAIALPALHIKYQLSGREHLRFSYKQGIVRPPVFQLNPNLQTIDFYTTQKGNPELNPELNHNLNLDYSLTFNNNFLNAGLFYTYKQDAIETLTLLNNEVFLEKEKQNLGNIHLLGVNASGNFKLHEKISINPHIRFYYVQTRGNDLAQAYHIKNKQAINFESALSAILLMKHNFALSVTAQYNSPLTRIQNDYREDALYFISFEKTFFDQLKLSITSAIPFKKEFTYQGYDISGRNFRQSTEENIQMSLFPVWFKLSYSFASGKKAKQFESENSFEENRPQKGF